MKRFSENIMSKMLFLHDAIMTLEAPPRCMQVSLGGAVFEFLRNACKQSKCIILACLLQETGQCFLT